MSNDAYGPDKALGGAGDALTTIGVRDMIIDCFTSTHGPRFEAQRVALGMDTGFDSLRVGVEGMIKVAFQQVGGDFEQPTVRDLFRVVNILAERSLDWGVSPEDVFENHCSITRTLGDLHSGLQ